MIDKGNDPPYKGSAGRKIWFASLQWEAEMIQVCIRLGEVFKTALSHYLYRFNSALFRAGQAIRLSADYQGRELKYMKTFDTQDIKTALQKVQGVRFKESGMTHDTYQWYKRILLVCNQTMTVEGMGTARGRASFNPSKADMMISKQHVKPGSKLADAFDQWKREDMQSVLDALKNDRLPEDVGMSDKAFSHVAKDIGVIPRSFASITDNGNYRFGKEEVSAWMAHRMAHIMELRTMADRELNPLSPIVPVPSTKGRKVKAA